MVGLVCNGQCGHFRLDRSALSGCRFGSGYTIGMALPGDHIYLPSQLACIAAVTDTGVAAYLAAAIIELDQVFGGIDHGSHDCRDHAR